MVTLALFETLVDLNCEDVMLELCLASLAPCSHVMLSQRRRLLRDLDPFGRSAEKFLSLSPDCCASSSLSMFPSTSAISSISPVASPSASPGTHRHTHVTSTGQANVSVKYYYLFEQYLFFSFLVLHLFFYHFEL